MNERFEELDRELRELRDRDQALCEKVRRFHALLADYRAMLDRCSRDDASFRAAKLVRMFRHPEWAGYSGVFSLAAALILAKFKRRPFDPSLLALDDLAKALESAEAEVEKFPVPPLPPVSAGFPATEKVSVILPVYNQADMLPESITSVLEQTYENLELIVLNDGSTDNVNRVVRRFMRRDSRVRYLVQPNQKLPAALTNAFRYAQGEYLTWTSADNRMRPDMIRRLADELASHPGLAMTFGNYSVITDSGEPHHEAWFRPHNKKEPESDEIFLPYDVSELNRTKDNFIGPCFMYRKTVYDVLGAYDPVQGIEDYDYWMRVNDLFRLAHLSSDDRLYEYRVHGNSLSGKAAEHRILEKSFALMKYESERAAFYKLPFDLSGSFLTTDFAVPYGTFLKDGVPPEKWKQICLIRGYELEQYACTIRSGVYTCVYFDRGEEKEMCRYSHLLDRENVKCFARPGTRCAELTGLFTDRSITCELPDFGRLAVASANNDLFFRKTRTAEQRTLRTPRGGAAGQGTIVLAVDALSKGGLEQVVYDMYRVFTSKGRMVRLFSFTGDRTHVPDDIPVVFAKPEDPEADWMHFLSGMETECVLAHHSIRGAQGCFRLGIPYHQIIHNTYVWFEKEDIRRWREAARYVSSFIAVSRRAAYYAAEKFGLPVSKMIVLENGVDRAKYHPDPAARKRMRAKLGLTDRNFLFLAPASCLATKGQFHLAHAFAEAYRENPDLRLIMAGNIMDEPYAEMVRRFLAEQHLEDVVTFGRWFPGMSDLYNAADAVVQSSFWEGCSLSAAEAVAMGKPLVSFLTGDIERQTGEVGVLLMDFPFRYTTDLDVTNYPRWLYHEHPEITAVLRNGLLSVASGAYPHGAYPVDRTAAEAYERYLKLLDGLRSGFSIPALRHNLDELYYA